MQVAKCSLLFPQFCQPPFVPCASRPWVACLEPDDLLSTDCGVDFLDSDTRLEFDLFLEADLLCGHAGYDEGCIGGCQCREVMIERANLRSEK